MENPAFASMPTLNKERCKIPVRYADKGTPAQTGAVMTAKMGAGTIVPVGLRARHRAQAYGTFKLLFNNLVE